MGSLLGSKINPSVLAPITGTAAQQQFLEALFGSTMGPAGAAAVAANTSAGTTSPTATGTPASTKTATGTTGTGATGTGTGSATPAFFGVAPYTGPLSPTQNPLLSGAYNSWQPWNAGTQYQANALPQIAGQIGPNKMASPGISNMVQFGTPSAVGNYLGNIAQYGAAGPAGMPLANLAQGQLTGGAQYLSPWLTGGGAGAQMYKPPSIFMPG